MTARVASRFLKTIACLGILVLAGLVSRPTIGPAWREVRASQPVLNQEALEDAVGQGLILGLFGGFRSLMADLTWVRTSFFWLNNDWPKTEAAILLTTNLDPRPLYFWVQGARILAYDVARWRLRELENLPLQTTPETAGRISEEQAFVAIALLERAMDFHPGDPRLFIEIAQIYNNVLEDPLAAAEYFGMAAELPGAPNFAGRLHAELLRRNGKSFEAYQYYIRAYPKLDPADPYSMRPLVLKRIRDLEAELDIPPHQQFRPGRG
jgi:hypothetical protein